MTQEQVAGIENEVVVGAAEENPQTTPPQDSQESVKPQPEKISPVQQRINELTAKYRDQERMNLELRTRLEAFEKQQTETILESKQAEFESKIAAALEAGDTALVAKLNSEQIKFIAQAASKVIPSQQTQPSQPTPPSVDPDLEDFKRYNPWFMTDKEKTDYAMTVDAQMKADPHWRTASQKDFLAELAHRVNTFHSLTTNPLSNYSPTGVPTNPPANQSSAPRLSALEQSVALKMIDGKNIKTKEQAYAVYAKYRDEGK